MGRSKSSDRPSTPLALPVDDPGQLRHYGAAGGYIREHRAFSTLDLEWMDLIAAAVLAACLTALWIGAAGSVCSLWAQILGSWQHALALPARVALKQYRLGQYLHWSIPYLTLTAAAPDRAIWGWTAAATLVLFGGSYLLPRQALPLIYLLRFVSGVQATSLVYFLVAPVAFPHALPDYIADMLAATLALMSTVPALLGFTFYVFRFGLLKKVGLTVMILGLLTLVGPLQYLVQAYFLYRCSLLFMPLFYLMLGLPLDVMMIIAFYGWGMSWEESLPPHRARATHAGRPRRVQDSGDPPASGAPGVASRSRGGFGLVQRQLVGLTGRLFPWRLTKG